MCPLVTQLTPRQWYLRTNSHGVSSLKIRIGREKNVLIRTMYVFSDRWDNELRRVHTIPTSLSNFLSGGWERIVLLISTNGWLPALRRFRLQNYILFQKHIVTDYRCYRYKWNNDQLYRLWYSLFCSYALLEAHGTRVYFKWPNTVRCYSQRSVRGLVVRLTRKTKAALNFKVTFYQRLTVLLWASTLLLSFQVNF